MIKFCTVALIALIGFTSQAHADVVTLSGLYETQFENGIIVPSQNNEACVPPNQHLTGTDMCIEPFTATNQLGMLLSDDGKTLDFATMLSFFNGHSCSIRGTAKKAQRGWQYTETLPDDLGTCVLDIYIDDQDIVLNSEHGSDCRNYYCGARGHLNDIRFPILSKTQDITGTDALDCISMLSDSCKKTIQPE